MSPPESRTGSSSVADRYRVLLDMGRRLTSTLSSGELFGVIHKETETVLEASGFYIALYDQGRDLARIVYYADQGEVKHVEISYRGSDSEVIRSRRGSIVEDELDEKALMILGDQASERTRSALSAPMIHKGRIVGAISVQSYEAGAYTEDDLDLLGGIADMAAIAIDNAMHFAELEQRRREAEQVEEIGRALTSELDPKEVLGKVIGAVLDVLNADSASVWLFEGPSGRTGRVAEAGGTASLPIGLTWDLDPEIAERLMESRRAIVVDDIASSPIIPDHLREHLDNGSGMAAPLKVGGQVAGVLTAGSQQARNFGETDSTVLQRLASQASVALENARLHTNLQALSLTDPLTGLPNRRRLQIHLDKEVAAARRGRNLVVVVFDIDDFKHYNDTFGHLVGDDILRAFAQILDDENRAMNLVARYGGDEFVSVLSESHMDGARLYVRRVTERVGSDPIMGEYGLSVSIGIAEFDRAAMKSMKDVIQAADMDMYSVKADRASSRRSATS